MVNPYIYRSAIVACASDIKGKNYKSLGYSQKRGYKEQVEGFNPGEIFQRARGPVHTGDECHV